VNSYHDGASDFADLLRAVGAVDESGAFVHEPTPNDFSDRVVPRSPKWTPCANTSSADAERIDRVLKDARRYSRRTICMCPAVA